MKEKKTIQIGEYIYELSKEYIKLGDYYYKDKFNEIFRGSGYTKNDWKVISSTEKLAGLNQNEDE